MTKGVTELVEEELLWFKGMCLCLWLAAAAVPAPTTQATMRRSQRWAEVDMVVEPEESLAFVGWIAQTLDRRASVLRRSF